MASLLRRSRRVGIALAVALGLTILSAVTTSLVAHELANVLPGVTNALANEPHGGN